MFYVLDGLRLGVCYCLFEGISHAEFNTDQLLYGGLLCYHRRIDLSLVYQLGFFGEVGIGVSFYRHPCDLGAVLFRGWADDEQRDWDPVDGQLLEYRNCIFRQHLQIQLETQLNINRRHLISNLWSIHGHLQENQGQASLLSCPMIVLSDK